MVDHSRLNVVEGQVPPIDLRRKDDFNHPCGNHIIWKNATEVAKRKFKIFTLIKI
uniref:Uncharacterized protein n=1 Tax=Triticum urartu TaxID=4572 RepID=A0A8R7JW31_TRIUA